MSQARPLPSHLEMPDRKRLSEYVSSPEKANHEFYGPHQINRETNRFLLRVAGGLQVSFLLLAALASYLGWGILSGFALFLFAVISIMALPALPQAYHQIKLRRAKPGAELYARPHAFEFENDGHLMFSVRSGSEEGRPFLQLISWEQQSAHQEDCLRCPEGSYRVRVLETVRGAHPDDVQSLAERKPGLEERARELETEASQALTVHRERISAAIEQARQEGLAASESARVLA